MFCLCGCAAFIPDVATSDKRASETGSPTTSTGDPQDSIPEDREEKTSSS